MQRNILIALRSEIFRCMLSDLIDLEWDEFQYVYTSIILAAIQIINYIF